MGLCRAVRHEQGAEAAADHQERQDTPPPLPEACAGQDLKMASCRICLFSCLHHHVESLLWAPLLAEISVIVYRSMDPFRNFVDATGVTPIVNGNIMMNRWDDQACTLMCTIV